MPCLNCGCRLKNVVKHVCKTDKNGKNKNLGWISRDANKLKYRDVLSQNLRYISINKVPHEIYHIQPNFQPNYKKPSTDFLDYRKINDYFYKKEPIDLQLLQLRDVIYPKLLKNLL